MEIKEMKELLAGVEMLLVGIKKIVADGKVNVADLPALMEMAQKASMLVAAVEGAKEIPAEVKDLSAEEAQELLAIMYALVKNVKAA